MGVFLLLLLHFSEQLLWRSLVKAASKRKAYKTKNESKQSYG